MRTIFALLALLVSPAAFSACYMIYAPSNELVWRGTTAPVPLDSLLISDEVQKLVPKGQMIIIMDSNVSCAPLDLTNPRKTMRETVQEMNNG